MIIPIWAQLRVKRTYKKYSKVSSSSQMRGAEVARKILDANGLYHVNIEEVRGVLSDHYDPRTKTVRLSSGNFHGHSIAAAAVAAHDVVMRFRMKKHMLFSDCVIHLSPLPILVRIFPGY